MFCNSGALFADSLMPLLMINWETAVLYGFDVGCENRIWFKIDCIHLNT